jgi:hypothetical protein
MKAMITEILEMGWDQNSVSSVKNINLFTEVFWMYGAG